MMLVTAPTESRRPYILLVLALVMVIAMGGCALKPKLTNVRISLVASPDVNPNARGRPSPMVVRVYELRSTGNFEAADFFGLLDKESTTLGAELLDREEYVVRPGEARSRSWTADPNARFIGVLGVYQNLDRARWSATVPLQQGSGNSFTVKLNRQAVSIVQR
jgi:type VI secretion system protein VasD